MELSRTEQMLLEAISAAIGGAPVSWAEVSEEEWNALMTLSLQHKIQPLVLDAVHSCPAAALWKAKAGYVQIAKKQAVSQTIKTTEFLALHQKLLDSGTKPLVLKGILCRDLYPNGELRQSGDEDLYVAEDDFSACCKILREAGMQPLTEADEQTADEIGWHSPTSPLRIELHRVLFDSRTAATSVLEALFEASHSDARQYSLSCGVTVSSLSPHDHLQYLLLHAYKHFIHSGFGIRQVADIGLWAKHYFEQIDWKRLYDGCEKTHTLKFSAAVFQIVQKDLGLSLTLPKQWTDIGVDRAPMLRDILAAGVYGDADNVRIHTAGVTLNAVAARQDNRRSSMLRTVFPSRAALISEYPILKEHRLLLPYVWGKRLGAYLKENKNGSQNAADTIKLAQERKMLLKEYGIL